MMISRHMSLKKIIVVFLLFYGVWTINLETVRKKELIAFTEMAAETADQLIQENTFVYYTPYLELNPVSTVSFADQFTGENPKKVCHKCILLSMIDQLDQGADTSKLSINQLAFLIELFEIAPAETKEKIKHLVEKKQLDFSGGLYTNPDQSTADFQDLLQQIIVGQQFLKENFNYVPSAASFLGNTLTGGYSPTLAYLLQKSSIQGIIVDPVNEIKQKLLAKGRALEFLWEYPSPKQNEGMWTHINSRNSKISPFQNLAAVAELATKQNDKMAEEFLKYLEELQKQKVGYIGDLFLEMINTESTELEKGKAFKGLEELVKVVNKIEELGGSKFAAQFSTITNFAKQLNSKGKLYPRINSLAIPRSLVVEQGVPAGVFSNQLMLKAAVRYNLELWRNVERLLVVEWVHGKLMKDHQLQKGKIESIHKDMQKFEKLLLILQNHEVSNNVEKSKDVKSNYMANINLHKQTILPKLSKLLTDKLKVMYQLTYPLNFFEFGSTTVGEALKETQTIGSILIFYNPTSHVSQRPVKLKVPNGGYRLVSNQNQEMPLDVICEKTECWMYFVLWIDSWGSAAVKLVKSDHSKALKKGTGEPKVAFEVERKDQLVESFSLKYKKEGYFELRWCSVGEKKGESWREMKQKREKGVGDNNRKKFVNKIKESLKSNTQQKGKVSAKQEEKFVKKIKKEAQEEVQAKKAHVYTKGQQFESYEYNEPQKQFIKSKDNKKNYEIKQENNNQETEQKGLNNYWRKKQNQNSKVSKSTEKNERQEMEKKYENKLKKAERQSLSKQQQQSLQAQKAEEEMQKKYQNKLKKAERQQFSKQQQESQSAQIVEEEMQKKYQNKLKKAERQQFSKQQQESQSAQIVEEEMQKKYQNKLERAERQQQQQSPQKIKNSKINKSTQQSEQIDWKARWRQHQEMQKKYENELKKAEIQEYRKQQQYQKQRKQSYKKQNVAQQEISSNKHNINKQKLNQEEYSSKQMKQSEQKSVQKKQIKQSKIQHYYHSDYQKENLKIKNGEKIPIKEPKQMKQIRQSVTKQQQPKKQTMQTGIESDDKIISDELLRLYKEQSGMIGLKNQIRRSLQSLLLSSPLDIYPSKLFQHNFCSKAFTLILKKISIEDTLATERAIEKVQQSSGTMLPDDERREIEEEMRREIVNEWNGRRVAEVNEIVKQLYLGMQRDDQEQTIKNQEKKWETQIKEEEKFSEIEKNLEQEEKKYDQRALQLKRLKNEIDSSKQQLKGELNALKGSQQLSKIKSFPKKHSEINTVKQAFKQINQQKQNAFSQRKFNYVSFLDTSSINKDHIVCLVERFKLEFLEYICKINEKECSDWAYFRTSQPPTSFLAQPKIEYYQGDVIGQIKIIYPEITTTLTVYRECIDLGVIEINTEINEMKFDEKLIKSKEIVATITSLEIVNNQKFTIDRNGFFSNQIKYQFPENKKFTIPSNYYSANFVGIQDETTKISMNLFMENPIGITSQKQGQIEVMLKRMFAKDQSVSKFRGFLSFASNGITQFKLKNILEIFKKKSSEISQILNSASLQFYAKTETALFEENKKINGILNLQNDVSIQLRFYEKDKVLLHVINLSPTQYYKLFLYDQSKNTAENIFYKITGSKIKCKNIIETTLSGTETKENQEKNQLTWRNVNSAQQDKFLFAEKLYASSAEVEQGTIVLKPLDVRAFLFEFEE